MRALLDVNLLIALLDENHESHQVAAIWFATHGSSGWASCPLTQNGVIRIMSNPGYANSQSLTEVRQKMIDMCSKPAHVFWNDDVSFLDETVFDQNVIVKGKHITDVYLLALAVKNKGCFVTFDRKFPTNCVKGYQSKNLVEL